MSTVAEIIEAVKRLDQGEKDRLLVALSNLETPSADPLEPFIGAFHSGAKSDWVNLHDARLGEHHQDDTTNNG